MNKHNKAFKQRVDKAGLAIQHLIKLGCAITEMYIKESNSVICILPPPKGKLKGTQITINGTLNGRQYMMATRLFGCTVKWEYTHEEAVA